VVAGRRTTCHCQCPDHDADPAANVDCSTWASLPHVAAPDAPDSHAATDSHAVALALPAATVELIRYC